MFSKLEVPEKQYTETERIFFISRLHKHHYLLMGCLHMLYTVQLLNHWNQIEYTTTFIISGIIVVMQCLLFITAFFKKNSFAKICM